MTNASGGDMNDMSHRLQGGCQALLPIGEIFLLGVTHFWWIARPVPFLNFNLEFYKSHLNECKRKGYKVIFCM